MFSQPSPALRLACLIDARKDFLYLHINFAGFGYGSIGFGYGSIGSKAQRADSLLFASNVRIAGRCGEHWSPCETWIRALRSNDELNALLFRRLYQPYLLHHGQEIETVPDFHYFSVLRDCQAHSCKLHRITCGVQP